MKRGPLLPMPGCVWNKDEFTPYWKRCYRRRTRRFNKTRALQVVEQRESDWNGSEGGAHEHGHWFWETDWYEAFDVGDVTDLIRSGVLVVK